MQDILGWSSWSFDGKCAEVVVLLRNTWVLIWRIQGTYSRALAVDRVVREMAAIDIQSGVLETSSRSGGRTLDK